MAKKVVFKSQGKLRDVLLNNTALKDTTGAVRTIKEGDFVKIGAALYPLLRFDSIPFSVTANGGNMDFQLGISDKLLTLNPTVVYLGSSTMEGHGMVFPNRLEDLLSNWYSSQAISTTTFNYSLGGQTMANLRTVANGGTTGRNCEAAYANNPSFVYIDEISNWANSYNAATQIAYMEEIFTYFFIRGIVAVFGGPRPRTQFTGEQALRLVELHSLLKNHPFLKYVTNLNFDLFLKPGTAHDIRADFDSGDGVHLNVPGNQALSASIVSFFQKVFKPVTAFNQYTIEKSPDGISGWAVIDTITDMTLNKRSLALQNGYFRCRARLKNNTFTAYSAITQLSVSNPTASAGIDRNEVVGTTNININGSGTAFGGATITGYSWSIISGSGITLSNATTANVSISGMTNGGTYVLRLTVTDSNGNTGFDDITIKVASSQTLTVNAGADQSIGTTTATLSATEVGATSRLWSKVTGPVSDYNYEWNNYTKNRTFVITPDPDGYKTINGASYLPGDALYLSGNFKGVQISNLLGTASEKILISNKPGEVTTIGNEAWASGSWSLCINLINCKHFRLSGTHRSKLLFKGSTNTTIGGDGYEVRSQVQNVRFDEYTEEFEASYFTVTNGGTGIWCKKEVVNGQAGSYYPNNTLDNCIFHNIEVSNTHNEAMYLGNTATYWNINTNQSIYPNPAVDPVPDPSIYKQPIKGNGWKVYNCKIANSGADGIQLSAIDNVEVNNNEVTNWATRQQPSHCAGILVGGRLTNWNVHDNYVHDGWGNIMEVYCEGNGTIKNNLLARNMIWNEGIAMRATNNAVVTIENNTIIDVNSMVRINGSHGQTSAQVIRNNLFVKWRNVRAIYGENGGLETVAGAPNNNDSFTTVAAANMNDSNWYLPAVSSKGFRKGIETMGLQSSMPSVIVSPTELSTSVTDLIPGSHVFRITSTNGTSSVYDDVQVTVA